MKVRIGLYSAGLNTYWGQFDGLYDCLMGYNKFIQRELEAYGEVFNFGMVDTEENGREAGEFFNRNNVDIVFSHSATYYTSATVLPIHQLNQAPVIVLNLQPAPEMNYEKTGTDRWLAQCVACPIPEIANAFNRAGIKYRAINGLLGLDYTPDFSFAEENTKDRPEAIKAWKEIGEWCKAAMVKRSLSHARFGFLGGYYSGMLDMYSDFTMLQAQTGMHIEVLEMCDLELYLRQVREEEIQEKLKEIHEFFQISGDSPSDPIAKKPTEEQLTWSAKVAVAQEKMVEDKNLDSISYYYHGQDNYYEEIQSGFIVGHSLLTAKGVACSGEGDIKTALAMKIADLLGTGGSFCEIVAADFNRDTMILGHDGPFHFKISKGKPILRGMGVYHGKRGSGVSVEAKVKQGPVTTIGITQKVNEKLHMNISEGEAIDAPILMNGNTSTHIKFADKPAEYMDKWFAEAPTHHLALSVGHNKELFKKVADIMDISYSVF
ncbi:L-arabinose isomerase [Aequitasia blattaphilus]|uniref:L-fucose/L-arabinose isomerase family protein n=1 Tax=Aequitasia blattaphilus TaxID=2949332 RepID=A0ABT1E9D4_9FIRM|nr:L-fucose/L-arabinose isomerase family protein [Aequitasia blattaphilus]MCP1102219.1 L-fucose/L-arabinose isomerase family protein [Aequitasia blattaphilus]MCR8614859.1 L-fucose/L-arabinose isomerase family protein [Aequitasia blattaphilus]